MKKENKLLLRKISSQLPQLIAAILIVAIGTAFFVTLKTVLFQYEKMSEKYYSDYALADYTVYGSNFTQTEIDRVKEQKGVLTAQGRYVYDYRCGEAVVRAISTSYEAPEINTPYVFEGRLPESDNECMVYKKYAEIYDFNIDDNIEIRTPSGKYIFKVTALVASPEYVYFAQSESVPMADPHDFGIVFLNEGFFKNVINAGYNQINILFDNYSDRDEAAKLVRTSLDPGRVTNTLFKDGQTSYKMYRDDLKQIDSFTYIFPVIFLVIASLIIYVMQKRNIVKERKQIGILKAMGLNSGKIILLYTKYAVFVALVGSITGCLFSILFGDYILALFAGMFEMPGLAFTVYPFLWLAAFLIALSVCTISNFLGIWSLLKISPAEAMHAEKPKNGTRIFIERIGPLWSSFSFNTRFALKNALRNKGRFFAVVLGMSAAVTLAIFSLGFNNSFEYLIKNHYDNFIKYDIAVNLPLTGFSEDKAFLSLPEIKDYSKNLILPVTVESKATKRDYPLLVLYGSFDMLDLKAGNNDNVTFTNGIVLPEYVAEKLSVAKGDKIKISSSGGMEQKEVTITDLTHQASSFFIYADYDFLSGLMSENKKVYNTVFIKTNDLQTLEKKLDKSGDIINYTSVQKDKSTLLRILETINVLISFLIVFAIVLGIAVLYAVGIINLTARNYEFVLLKVMGYGTGDIMLAHIKETLLQLILAVPMGFLAGSALLEGIKDEFSNDSFALTPYIDFKSYLLAVLMLLVITALIAALNIRHIRRIDIVEGLKTREE